MMQGRQFYPWELDIVASSKKLESVKVAINILNNFVMTTGAWMQVAR